MLKQLLALSIATAAVLGVGLAVVGCSSGPPADNTNIDAPPAPAPPGGPAQDDGDN